MRVKDDEKFVRNIAALKFAVISVSGAILQHFTLIFLINISKIYFQMSEETFSGDISPDPDLYIQYIQGDTELTFNNVLTGTKRDAVTSHISTSNIQIMDLKD